MHRQELASSRHVLSDKLHLLPARQPLLARKRRSLQQTAAEGGAGVLQRLGRVLKEKAQGDLDRVFKGTSKTRERMGVVEELFTYWTLEDADDTLEELEDILIGADFGPSTAFKIVDGLRASIKAGRIKSGDEIRAALKSALVDILTSRGGPSTSLEFGDAKPGVILVVGVNGGGKTTTIGKLAHSFTQEGAKVVLAAGDTFRAAASDQLAEWASRSGAEMVAATSPKQRPDYVLNIAVEKAMKSGADVVICDTSGRLHTNYALMEELAKCRRSISSRMASAPHETLLVLDATTGLNMLNQAQEFHETVPLTGLVLTKLDGSARGGAVVSVVDALGVPVKFVGVGETVADLQPFDATAFVDALFPSMVGAGAE